MTYSGLTTTGGSITWASGGNGISEDSRTLPLLNSGVVYLQFLGQFGSSSGGGTPNLRLLDSGTLTGGFGGNGGTHGSVVSILDNTLHRRRQRRRHQVWPVWRNQNLVVARIDYQADTTSMWVNPNLT